MRCHLTERLPYLNGLDASFSQSSLINCPVVMHLVQVGTRIIALHRARRMTVASGGENCRVNILTNVSLIMEYDFDWRHADSSTAVSNMSLDSPKNLYFNDAKNPSTNLNVINSS